MKSFSLFRIFKKGLGSFKFGKSTPFAYFTRAIFCNYYNLLKRYYRRLNNHQKYVRGELARLDTKGNPKLEQFINDFVASFEADGNKEEKNA